MIIDMMGKSARLWHFCPSSAKFEASESEKRPDKLRYDINHFYIFHAN